jgi:hypothetical protein
MAKEKRVAIISLEGPLILVYNEERDFEGGQMVRISFFVFLNHNMLKHAWQLPTTNHLWL